MSESLLLIRAGGHELDALAVDLYYQSAANVLESVAGFHGASLWRDSAEPGYFLTLHRFESKAAAEAGLLALSSQPSYGEIRPVSNNPADVMRTRVAYTSGGLKGGKQDGKFLSVSIRVAEPGYSAELVEEYSRIFDECLYIPGFVGALIGVSESMEEEMTGLITWQSEEAYKTSLPPSQQPYLVKLYERVR